MLAIKILYIIVVISLWIAMIMTVIQITGAFIGGFKGLKKRVDEKTLLENITPVSIIVPAHNEEKVIITTCIKIASLNYPKDMFELIVVNDASTDNSAQLLEKFKNDFSDMDITIINTTKETGGGQGKTGALKHGINTSKYDTICVFDADASPEKNSVALLVNKMLEDESYCAAVGRNKCRNRDHNLLTKFINLELCVSQKVVHVGNWQLFKIGKIPGTNFIIKKSALEDVDGFTDGSLTEDTDLTFKLHYTNHIIAYEPRSEAYQQEPEKLSVFIHQRKRWAHGNLVAAVKFFPKFFSPKATKMFRLSLLNQLSVHIWFIFAITISNIFFIWQIYIILHNFFSTNDIANINTLDPNSINVLISSWAVLFLFYVLQINYALITEKGQQTSENFLLSIFSYITYAQLFFVISLLAFVTVIKNKIFGTKEKWYKTERF